MSQEDAHLNKKSSVNFPFSFSRGKGLEHVQNSVHHDLVVMVLKCYTSVTALAVDNFFSFRLYSSMKELKKLFYKK